MSQELVMSFVRVPLIAAALVLSIGSATAGESTDNLQQIRELLAGRVATHAARASAPEPAVKAGGRCAAARPGVAPGYHQVQCPRRSACDPERGASATRDLR